MIPAAILSILLFGATSCNRPPSIIVPQNEWGHIESFGEIIDGQITPELAAKIKGKTVAVISKAALYDYTILKKYANDHNIIYRLP